MTAAPGELALRVEGLSKTYRRLRHEPVQALKDVQLHVPRGTAFGLIGPNGAGKTTLIKTILGVVQPSEGHIEVLGLQPSTTASRQKLGYLPERLTLPEAWSPKQFLRSVARYKGVHNPTAVIEQLLEEVGLNGEERPVGRFSKGMKQRLGLAGAMLGRPELLILDEPTDGIDPIGRREIRDLLVLARSRGTTLLLNSHLLSETERICDSIAILNRGRLIRQGNLEDLALSGAHWRAQFERANEELLLQAGWRTRGTHFETEAVDAEALDQRLAAARATGALLSQLQPASRSLEDILSDTVTEQTREPSS